MNNHMTSKEFLVGAALGGLLGTTSALLMAPKSGKRLRQDICDMCEEVSDKTHDTACDVKKKGKEWIKTFSSQTSDLGEKAGEVVENIKEWLSSEKEEEEEGRNMPRDLLIGGLAGAIVGVTIGLLAAPKAGSRFRQDIADTYGEFTEKAQDAAEFLARKGKSVARNVQSSAEDWVEIAQQVIEQLKGEGLEREGRGKGVGRSDKLNHVMDLASLGVRLWQSLKQRR